MKQRVECDNCANFIHPILIEEGDFFSGIKENAKCKLGKRVMFRMPKSPLDDDYGYIRICDTFIKTEKK